MKTSEYIFLIGLMLTLSIHLMAQNSFEQPIEIGSKASSFTFVDTKNTVNFSNNFGQPSNEIYYKFTITCAMDISIDHCGSVLYDTYVHLLNSSGVPIDSNDDDWEYMFCLNPMNSYLYITNLAPGTYYVVSEGYWLNGSITTTINGISPMDVYSEDIGFKSSSFIYTDTKNTINGSNHYIGRNTNDVFYKFTLTRSMDVVLSHCGSALSDTYIHLLSETGMLIDENDDNYYYGCGNALQSYLYKSNLEPGTYYVVAEGYSQNGSITTSIQGIRPENLINQNGGVGLDPDKDKNYTLIITPTIGTSDAGNLNTEQSIQTLQYYDGLGHPIQNVQRNITPYKNDLVSTIEYDETGREVIQWLPTAIEDNQGAFVDFDNFAKTSRSFFADGRPFNETIIESSPLNRITGKKGPGIQWNTHPVSLSYETNDATIAHFSVNNIGILQKEGNYTAGMLYKTESKDEDSKTVEEYKNKLGQVVLKRSINDNDNIDTYYVYNDLGQLCYVIPPKAVDELISYDDNNEILKQYCYLYKYDERGNCKQKRLPGCDWIYMVYDGADRLILSQDGNQRLKSRKEWTVVKYDNLGRVLYTGITANDTPHEDLIADLEDEIITESWDNNNSFNGIGYTCGRFPPISLLTVNYYDNYNFLSTFDAPIHYSLAYDSNKEQEYGMKHTSAKGLLTGTRTYLLDGSDIYTIAAMYYDMRGRMLQNRSTNCLGGFDMVYTAYNFSGQITMNLTIHNIAGQTSYINELYTYDYDHAGRVKSTKYKLNNNPEVVLADMTASGSYDEQGRLKKKRRHSVNNSAFEDVEEFDYNIRNWITRIKSGEFEEKLYYNTELPNGISPQYNGNIAMNTWTYNGSIHKYAYNYDGLNRLLACTNYNTNNQPSGWFTESFTYDKMGNINTLWRMGAFLPIDALTLTYNGNQLKKVDDLFSSQNQYNIKEYNNRTNQSVEFEYDANGNMITDLDRDIVTIKYNVLNLPVLIQFRTGDKIVNTYSAGGQKLKSEYYTYLLKTSVPLMLSAGDLNSMPFLPGIFDYNGTAYIGNKEYDCNKLYVSPTYTDSYQISRLHNPEGYLSDPGGYAEFFSYYRKDHLGNNREVWQAPFMLGSTAVSAQTSQVTQYYPSGLPWESNSNDYPDRQPYKYNGKEYVEMGGLNAYDSNARWYFPDYNQTPTIDPLCEKYYSISPYAWCVNNPVKFIDPDGREVWIAITDNNGRNTFVQYKNNQLYNRNGTKYTGNNEFVLTIQNTLNNLLELGDNFVSKVVNTLVESEKKHVIEKNTSKEDVDNVSPAKNNFYGAMKGEKLGSNMILTLSGKPIEVENNLPTTKETTLGHELRHAYDYDQGLNKGADPVGSDVGSAKDPMEIRAIGFENRIRAKLNIRLRTHYGRNKIAPYTQAK